MDTQKEQKMQKQSMLLEDLLAGEVHTYMSAGMLGVGTYYPPVSWTTLNRPTYMLAGMLGVCIYFMAVSWTTCNRYTYMWLACLEHAHILWLLAGPLEVPTYVCWQSWSTGILSTCQLDVSGHATSLLSAWGLGLEGFRHWLQLMCCACLYSKSKV